MVSKIPSKAFFSDYPLYDPSLYDHVEHSKDPVIDSNIAPLIGSENGYDKSVVFLVLVHLKPAAHTVDQK